MPLSTPIGRALIDARATDPVIPSTRARHVPTASTTQPKKIAKDRAWNTWKAL
ncbi:hypothetical protein ACFSTC_53035 [Nonomuraea ferruginea]